MLLVKHTELLLLAERWRNNLDSYTSLLCRHALHLIIAAWQW